MNPARGPKTTRRIGPAGKSGRARDGSNAVFPTPRHTRNRCLQPRRRSNRWCTRFPTQGNWRHIFAFGVIGLGLLAIPVLAGSAAYALAEALDWKEGLSKKFGEARGFYGIIMIATLIGLALNFIGIDPMKALVYTAVFNGIAAVPLLFVIARLGGRADVLGAYRGGPLSRFFVWLAFIVMAIAGMALVYTTLRGGS